MLCQMQMLTPIMRKPSSTSSVFNIFMLRLENVPLLKKFITSVM